MAVIFYPPRTGGGGGGAATWGSITGTLSSQTDLQTALNGKSDVGHTHTNISSLLGFVTSEHVTAPNNPVAASRILVTSSGANADFVLTSKGTGSILAQLADNAVTGGNKRGINAVDLQMTRALATQVASGQNSALVGGASNTASGTRSGVFSGNANNVSSTNGAIVGGSSNTASTNDNSTVVGGSNSTASGSGAAVVGAQGSTATNTNAVVIGGASGNATGVRAIVIGGTSNDVSGSNSVAIGGSGNNVTDLASAILAGSLNTNNGLECVILASKNSLVPSGGTVNNAAILGGQNHSINGTNSIIFGGRGVTLTSTADNSFCFNGANSLNTVPISIATANTGVFNNVDLWLSNNDNTVRSLRFYEQYNASGAFPNTANFVALRAPNSIAADVTWTLPNADGTNGQVLQTDGTGTLSWATAGGGVTGFTGTQNTAAPNNTVNASRLLVSASSTNADFVVQPKGTGAILAQLPDSTATGGNKRGDYAVDLQMLRSSASQVASGVRSLAVGNNNTSSGTASVSLGTTNTASSTASIALGNSNTSGGASSVALGFTNTSSGSYSTAIGGSNNCSNNYSVGIGGLNTVSGVTAIGIGYNNTSSGTCSIAIGEQLTANGSYSVATNYNNDVNSKGYSFVMLRGGRLQNDYTFTIGSYRSTTGDGQATIKILHAATTNATPTAMTGSGGSATYAFPSSRNVSVIATIQAMDSSGNGGMFVRQALFSRTLAAQIGTTQTVGTDIVSGALSGISVALAYSSGNLNVNVTGLGSTNIQWLCKLELTELQYS